MVRIRLPPALSPQRTMDAGVVTPGSGEGGETDLPAVVDASRGARPSHRGGRSGGVLRWIGWTRSPPCLRPRKGDAPSACANYKNRTGENACAPSPVL